MIAANLSLYARIVQPGGRVAWMVGGMILGANLLLCGIMGLVLRFRLIPLMAMFSTAALTEALLWQSATSGRDPGWIILVAMLGAVAIIAGWHGLRTSRRRLHRRG